MAKSGMNWLHQLLGSSSQVDTIRGGLALPRNKPGLTDPPYIHELDIPAELVIPLLNYRQEICAPLVKVGHTINIGDLLASGVIACANGTVTAIEKRSVIHPSQRQALCVVIATDSNSNNSSAHPPQDELTLERMEDCAIHGLGGAGFSTAEKFQASITCCHGIDTLIINAVECEPMISCDEALMMSSAEDIVSAVRSLIRMTRCHRCILAIENDKTQALTQIRLALASDTAFDPTKDLEYTESEQTTANVSSVSLTSIELQLLSPVYPSGAERPLIERVTGVRLIGLEKPVEHGIVCINVATALAAWRAQHGEPLISRIVTIAGEHAKNPTNVRIRFGTSISDALRMSGNADFPIGTRIRVGGPLSGFDMDDLSAPITATSNCIAIEAPIKTIAPSPCIRCGVCSEVCPVNLLPQQLYWYAKSDDLNNSTRFGLDSCIECGCCDVVCPSSIPLTQTFRYARDALREQNRQTQLAALAEQRFQQRELRQAARVLLREEKREAARTRLQTSTNDPIADALERAKRRKRVPKKTGPSNAGNNELNGDSA